MSERHEDSFVFYRSFFEAMDGLLDSERLSLYDAIVKLALDGEKATLVPPVKGLFVLIVPQIEANCRKRAHGKNGGRPPIEKPVVIQTENQWLCEEKTSGYEMMKPNENVNENTNDNFNGNGNVNKTKLERFTPPTLDDVKAYCFERNNRVDPERFIDYYTANGWKVGKNSMKDWKAAVRTWESTDGGRTYKKKLPFDNYDEHRDGGKVLPIELDLSELDPDKVDDIF